MADNLDRPLTRQPAGRVASQPGAARVLCVGHAAHDSVFRIDAFPAQPTKVAARRLDRSIGGMAANAACAIAALGGKATFWGPLGDDETAALIRSEFAQAGVDASGALSIHGAQSSQSAIIVDARGERLIISQRGSALEAGAQALAGRPLEADAVLVDVRWNAGADLVVRRARAAGLPIVLDGEMGNPTLLRCLVPMADHLIFSEPGFAEWLGRAASIDTVSRHLSRLVAAGARLAAVTHGERGVVFCTADGARHLPALPVAAVETLGAGDVFHGAYALRLAEGASIEDALRFAVVAAAIKCSRVGGRAGLPRRAEVDSMEAVRLAAVNG